MTHPDVTDAELAVMQQIWNSVESPPTIRAIADTLYPGGGAAHYATVQKLLDRLEQKGFVQRDGSKIPHRFAARVDREELIGRRLRDLADQLCGGSLTPIFSNLVESTALKKSDIQELRDLIDRLDNKPARKRRA